MKALMKVVTGPDTTMIRISEKIVGSNHFYFADELRGITGFLVKEEDAIEIQRRLYRERNLLSFILKEN